MYLVIKWIYSAMRTWEMILFFEELDLIFSDASDLSFFDDNSLELSDFLLSEWDAFSASCFLAADECDFSSFVDECDFFFLEEV